MNFQVMYEAGYINGKRGGYKQMPSRAFSEETQRKIVEEIEAMANEHERAFWAANLAEIEEEQTDDVR
jgi:DNA-binding cell septation regulator SpoVG